MWRAVKKWWREHQAWKRARRELDQFLATRADVLRTTSLAPKHRSRTQVLRWEEDPRRVLFGIVRHPRPYSFSRQYHEVLEIWCLYVNEQRLERLRGHNLTRAAGKDG